jgi:penicillin amidase
MRLSLVAGLISAGFFCAQAHSEASSLSSAVRQSEVALPGLGEPADIIIDHWGVAHIFAAGPKDAFFLQGYNAARDRLWQIDLWRKRGLGLLAKSLGPAYIAQDRAARLFLYRGDMQTEWAAYAPESKSWVESFTQGINAYVAEVRAGRRPLPVEFKLTQSEPERCPADSQSRPGGQCHFRGEASAHHLRRRCECRYLAPQARACRTCFANTGRLEPL